MKGSVKVLIYTSFGKKWTVSFMDKKTVDTFIDNIDDPDFPWVVFYPNFSKVKVKIRSNAIVALEILENEEEKDNE